MNKEPQFRCTVCGQIGTVGRCCGDETRIPLNDEARADMARDQDRRDRAAKQGAK